MGDFYNQLDLQKVLSYLKSSKYIEQQLVQTYNEPEFARVEYRKYKKRRPLLLRELYLLIVKIRDFPTINQFEKAYINRHRIKQSEYFSEVTAVRKAYNSLIRDLHFYFLLKESGKFDNVEIKYRFDLHAQTDILLQKGDKRLGLQLFTGDKKMKELKQQHYRKHGGVNNFELLFFGTGAKGQRKLLKTDSGVVFTLYSECDVGLVLKTLLASDTIVPSLNDDNFAGFDDFIENHQPMPSTVEKNLEAKHSILEIGYLSDSEIETTRNEYRRRGIAYYYCELNVSPNIKIYDGIDFENYEARLRKKNYVGFNIDQYKIEHELKDADIAVMAGAGSGKTYTLVSRTLYLLNMGYIDHVYEVAMITFTNEAANNILIKLSERFIEMYETTKDNRFLRYLEELVEMKIMTIPSFAKFMLKDYGHHIGLGQNLTISALTMKTREFIEKYLDEVYRSNSYHSDILEGIEYYQVRDFIVAFKEKLEQKGVFAQNLVGKVPNNKPFESLIIKTLADVEKSLNDYKQERDILGLSDLTRYLKRLIDSNRSMESLNKKFKYLFIDEFQDTDNLQIEFVVNLSVNARIPLLVVGDIKQGIYRFRGANVTAFEIISQRLKESDREILEHRLVKNYRTASDVLNNIEDIFSRWRTEGFLPKDDATMQPTRSKSMAANSYIEYDEKVSHEEILKLYHEMVQRPKQKPKEVRVLSILVRTNRAVLEINNLLTERCHHDNIPIQIVKEGTLFKTAAAKDLSAVLYSWLNPDDAIALFELSQTAFCKSPILPPIKEVDGYYEMDDLCFEIPETWEKALEQFKLAPANIVLNEFLATTPFKENLESKLEDKVAVKQYILNLHKIMTLMSDAIQGENADLYSLYKWLSLEIAINKRDDEAELTDADFDKDYIKVMTVHKSKGLEFDTVIIPYVHDPFVLKRARDCEILVETDENNVEYAWHLTTEKGFADETENYHKMMDDEKPQILREETRNLYVALTRAKECLAIFDMKRDVSYYLAKNPNSWHHLIKGGR